MGNKMTTSTILLGISLTSPYADQTDSQLYNWETNLFQTMIEETEFNNPSKIHADTEDYFNDLYNEEIVQQANEIHGLDIRFFRTIQEFAKNQKELDEDFAEVLNEMIAESVNNKPRKKRF